MKDWIEEEINCDYVDAKYQRMIDKIKIKKEDKN